MFSALETGLGRRVAIKVLDVDLSDASTRRRFDRECAAIAALADAPGIVPVYAATMTDDGRGCIVMRLMVESMSQRLRRSGPLPTAIVHHAASVVAEALAHAHGREVYHRDIKPANLLMSEHGEVALADFDIASVGGAPLSTQTHDAMSPAHASPERLAGQRHDGVSSDIWSFGSTMFTLLEGRAPFGTAQSPGGMAGLVRRVMTDPVPPSQRTDVPADFEAIIRRSMAKEPGDRWSSAADIVRELAEVEPGSPRPPRWVARADAFTIDGHDVDSTESPVSVTTMPAAARASIRPRTGTSPEVGQARLDHALRARRTISPVAVGVGLSFLGAAIAVVLTVLS